jgi:DNA processing protein
MSEACEHCLRRSFLVARLAPRIARLLQRPGRPARGLLGLDEEELIAAIAGRAEADARGFLERFAHGEALARVEAAGVLAACRHSHGYPGALAGLDDPPAVLYARGAGGLAALESEPAVAVVGARRASPYGLELAYSLGRGLGAAGVSVVSGLALGVDAAAHRGCLDGGGAAVAVLACGPDVVYPRQHRRLYERLLATGVVLSEMPPGTPPFRWAFPARNRLMAGLARMTVVVEAAERSGSLITAEFAQDLGRAVGAVPGRVTSRTAAGSNALLQDGAEVVVGAQDVLDELFGAGARTVEEPKAERLEPSLRAVLDAIEGGAGAEGIARACELSAREVRVALARLEASGHVRRDRLGGYERAVAR